MAIDTGQPVRVSEVRRTDNTTFFVRHGIENGSDFTAGVVVVEEDGVLRLGNGAETENYHSANAFDARKAEARAAGLAVKNAGTVAEFRAALETFLTLMFKEVFS